MCIRDRRRTTPSSVALMIRCAPWTSTAISPSWTRLQRTSFPAARGPSCGTLTRTWAMTRPAGVGARSTQRTPGSSPQLTQQSESGVAPNVASTAPATARTLVPAASRFGAAALHSLSRMLGRSSRCSNARGAWTVRRLPRAPTGGAVRPFTIGPAEPYPRPPREVSSRMSVDRRLVNLGVFLLILGAIPLAVSQGWIARETVSHAWELWPLILIGIGIGLILRRTPFHFVGGLLVAATFGTMFGALLAGGLSLGAVGCGNATAATDPLILDEHGTFVGGTTGVVLRATCASLSVVPVSGAAWGVTVAGKADERPTLEQAAGRLQVRSPDRTVVLPFEDGRRSQWNVTLGTDVVYTLDVNLNAGEANIDLAALRVDALTAQGNAVGNSRLLLHDATILGRLDVQINAGDLK